MPSTYKASTYAAAALWLEDSKVTYRPNPKSGKSFVRYSKYEKAKTIGESLSLGSKPEDLLFDFEHGHLQVSAPTRARPLDLFKIQDFEQLTYTDKILGRYTCRFDPKRKAQSEVIQESLKEGIRKRQMAMRRIRKLELAKTYGVRNVDDIRDSKGYWESGETMARRSVAQKEAVDILKVVRKEARKVSDVEVLRVLRLWGFRQNTTRRNVMQEGQSWIYSDTLGVTADRTGHILIKEEAKLYPDVCMLLCQWLKDHLPGDIGEKFQWTSININKNYAGRIHRDGSNVGPSFLKAFGSFKGGCLNYFGEDNRKIGLEELDSRTKDLSVKLDVSRALVLFDGNRAHSVDAFEGERYSLVFFSCPRYWLLPKASQTQLVRCGFRYPTKPAMQRLQSVVPAPCGYPGQAALVTRGRGTAATKKGRNAVTKLKAAAAARKAGGSVGKLMPVMQWSHDTPEKKRLERQAAKYWGKRPARQVHEEAPKDADVLRPKTTLGLPSLVRHDSQEWHSGLYKVLGPKRPSSHKALHFPDYGNMGDAVTALNGDLKGVLVQKARAVPKAIAKAGYCTIFSKRAKVFYLLYRPGCREKAFDAFGLQHATPGAKRAKTGA